MVQPLGVPCAGGLAGVRFCPGGGWEERACIGMVGGKLPGLDMGRCVHQELSHRWWAWHSYISHEDATCG